MKILIADKMSSGVVKELEKLGGAVSVQADLTENDLPGAIKDFEVLIVRSTKVNKKTIEAGASLSLIIRAGAGVNTIDLETASSHGVHVANCPGRNTDAVAELAIGLLIAADRRIAQASRDLQAGKWRKKEYEKAFGLKDRTLGILGVGSIGKAVTKIAQGMNMKVAAWSRSLSKEKAEALGVIFCATPLDVAIQSDAVSIHLAAKPETTKLVNESFLSKMKNGAILINTSRGEVVDTAALKKAIKEKNLRVGLDVYEGEPAGGEAEFKDTELAAMTVGTPHIGASTEQASEAIAAHVVEIVRSYKEKGKPENTVNIRKETTAKKTLVVRHFNKVGVMAGVLDRLREADVNIEEMENTIFTGGTAASCTLLLDSEPSAEILAQIGKDKNIMQVSLK
ncbi:MAG TPA: NAD(P)-dependent oxidoreductase [Elusimicrobiota bacterium]|nr:NAD(P)-dependent oxidoreductase [Elusimicrobiota bacterium]